jgi:hypothetical protein
MEITALYTAFNPSNVWRFDDISELFTSQTIVFSMGPTSLFACHAHFP